ncbi:uncharacterized protein [Ciconia boyciana]|uniref:uncharacterized protein n=1 Tax=Ciconia boyciana TaxID=52775 RepID=UPI003B9E5B46
MLPPGVRAPALAPPARRRRPAHARCPGAAWRRAGRGSRRRRASWGSEAALSTRSSLPPLGLPVTAPASGLRGLSVPGLALLAAWGRKGTGGALAGCGRELPRLKLERPEKAKEEEIEGRPASSCLPLQARESLPLRVRKDPSSSSTAGEAASVHRRVEDSQATGVTEEEGRREGDKKRLNWQSLLVVPRARAVDLPEGTERYVFGLRSRGEVLHFWDSRTG